MSTSLSTLNSSTGSFSSLSPKQRWVVQPNQRGTIDIIWSCVTTLAICCWVMLHLNLPARTDSQWTLFVRKARWLVLALLAPELVMLFACGQWASAKRSVQRYARIRPIGLDYDTCFLRRQWRLRPPGTRLCGVSHNGQASPLSCPARASPYAHYHEGRDLGQKQGGYVCENNR